MILSSPAPQFGQCRMSMSNSRLSSRAQLMRPGRAWAISTAHGPAAETLAASSSLGGPCGTTSVRSLAVGASTPWFA